MQTSFYKLVNNAYELLSVLKHKNELYFLH